MISGFGGASVSRVAASASAWATRRALKQLWPSPWSGSAGRAAAVLRLEVVDDDGDRLASAGGLEGLDQRRAVEHRVGGGLGRADRGDHRGAVDERHLDGVGAEGAPELVRRVERRLGDGGVGARCRRRVEGVDQAADRRRAVVLDLHEAEDVGVDAEDRRHLLRLLASELLGVVRAAGVRVVVGEGREVVQRVEAGDPDVAPDGRGRRRPRVRAGEGDRRRRLQPVLAEAEAEDAGDPGRLVADAHRLGREVRHRRRVLDVGPVVEEQPAPGVQVRHGLGLGPGRHPVGGLEEAAVGRHGHLAEAAELEVLGRGEGLREGQQHALDRLERGAHRAGQVVGDSAATVPVPQTSTTVTLESCGEPERLGRRAGDEHVVAGGHGRVRRHEHPVGGGRVGVGRRVLQEEAAQPGRALEVAGDDAFDADALAGDGRAGAAALHLGDLVGRRDVAARRGRRGRLEAAVARVRRAGGEVGGVVVGVGRRRRRREGRPSCSTARAPAPRPRSCSRWRRSRRSRGRRRRPRSPCRT